MKKIILLFGIFSSQALFGAYYKGCALKEASPAHIEFAWDLHDVLFKKQIGVIALKAIKYHRPLAKLKFSRTQKYKDIRKIWKELKESGSTGEVFYHLLITNNENKLANVIEELAAQQKPIKGMEAIVCELAQLGYTQRVASNIGSKFLVKLKQKKSSRHIFSHLTNGTVVEYNPEKPIIQKPNHEFYAKHTQTFNPSNKKVIIFIDDKLENVIAAQKAGWIGIHFSNAHQLRNDLQELGIKLKDD